MAITAAGLFGLTLEKLFIASSFPASGIESESALSIALVDDTITPNFDTHDFWSDLESGEASGTGYTAGGQTLTGTEVTLSGGVLTFDATDPSWPTSTIPDVMGGVIYFDRGGVTTADELFLLMDFITAASSDGGTFLVALDAAGILNLDYTP